MLDIIRSRPFVHKTKQLLLTFFLIFVSSSSVQAVDFTCPGGHWITKSDSNEVDLGIVIPYPCYSDPRCPGAYTTTISGNTKTDFRQWMYGCEYCNCGCKERTVIYQWRCCDPEGATQACTADDGCPGSQTCIGGEWDKCQSKRTGQCCEDPGQG